MKLTKYKSVLLGTTLAMALSAMPLMGNDAYAAEKQERSPRESAPFMGGAGAMKMPMPTLFEHSVVHTSGTVEIAPALTLTLAPGVSLFDGQGVMDKGERVFLPHDFYKGLNEGMSELLVTFAKNPESLGFTLDKKDVELQKVIDRVLLLKDYKGSILDKISFYELKGSDAKAHHAAYILTMELNKDVYGLLLDEKAKTLRSYSKEEIRQLHKDLLGKSENGLKTKNQEMMKSIAAWQVKVTKEALLARDKDVFKKNPNYETILKAMAEAQSIEWKNYSHGKEVQLKDTYLLPTYERVIQREDWMTIATSSVGYHMINDKNVVLTAIVMNDNSAYYWLPLIEQMTGLNMPGGAK